MYLNRVFFKKEGVGSQYCIYFLGGRGENVGSSRGGRADNPAYKSITHQIVSLGQKKTLHPCKAMNKRAIQK